MKTNRKLLWLIFAAMLYLSFCIIGGIWMADGTLHPPRRAVTEHEAGDFHEAVLSMKAELRDVAIVARDGIKLQAWVVRPRQPNGDAVVLFHGLGDNRLGMTGYAELLLARGFTVLLPDARAHGASGGNVASFGILERYDIAQWVQFLRTETKAGCILELESRWARRNCFNRSERVRLSAQLLPNLRSVIFARSRMTAWGNHFISVPGSGELSCGPWLKPHSCERVGGTAWICSPYRQRMR